MHKAPAKFIRAEAGVKVEQSMKRAAKLEQKRIEADLAELERDAASVEQKIYQSPVAEPGAIRPGSIANR